MTNKTMRADQLIQAIKDACGNNLERRVSFIHNADICTNDFEDQWQTHVLEASRCSVDSRHPNTITINLSE